MTAIIMRSALEHWGQAPPPVDALIEVGRPCVLFRALRAEKSPGRWTPIFAPILFGAFRDGDRLIDEAGREVFVEKRP